MPQSQEKKGNKRIRQKENKITRLTYCVKRPPNVSEIKIIKKDRQNVRGHLHTEPARRESNPASRLVTILLKHYIQYIRAVYKGQERNNTHTRATLTQTYLKRRNHSATIKGNRGEQREGRHPYSSKANSEPKKTVVQPTKATEGEQREGRHKHSSKKLRAKETTVQPAKATEADKLEPH